MTHIDATHAKQRLTMNIQDFKKIKAMRLIIVWGHGRMIVLDGVTCWMSMRCLVHVIVMMVMRGLLMNMIDTKHAI